MSSLRIPVRWADLDPLGHVNTAVFLTYLEEGRDSWLLEVLGDTFSPDQYVVARVEINYRHEIPAGTRYVHAHHECVGVGTSSITTEERLDDGNGTVFAEAQVVLVLWDRESRKPRPAADAERVALQGLAPI
jgi:acyl-CoA thioester hydrolase